MQENRRARRAAERAARKQNGPATIEGVRAVATAAAHGFAEVDGSRWTFVNGGTYVLAAPTIAVPAESPRVTAQLEGFLAHDLVAPLAPGAAFEGKAELLRDVAEAAAAEEKADRSGRRAKLWVGVTPFPWEPIGDVALALLGDDDDVRVGTFRGVDGRTRLRLESASLRVIVGPSKVRGDEPAVPLLSAAEIVAAREAEEAGVNAQGGSA